MKDILRCSCGAYTFNKQHCDGSTTTVVPPKYAPDDKYASYRRKVKEEVRKVQGLL